MNSSISIRAAVNADAEAIRALQESTEQGLPGVTFDDIEGYWLVTEWKGRIVGCIQTCYGKPVASLEMMAVEESLPGMIKGHVVRALLIDGMAILRARGAVWVRGFVPFRLKTYKRALKSRGAQVCDQGNMLFRRVG